MDPLERLADAPIALGARDPADAEPERHVGPDVEVREQAVALEDHADVALVGRHAHDVRTADGDTAGVRLLETGGHAQGRGLPAPGRAEQAHQLARLEGEVERLERDGRAERLADGVELERRGHGYGTGPASTVAVSAVLLRRRVSRVIRASRIVDTRRSEQAEGEAALHLAQGELLVEGGQRLLEQQAGDGELAEHDRRREEGRRDQGAGQVGHEHPEQRRRPPGSERARRVDERAQVDRREPGVERPIGEGHREQGVEGDQAEVAADEPRREVAERAGHADHQGDRGTT